MQHEILSGACVVEINAFEAKKKNIDRPASNSRPRGKNCSKVRRANR